ncbi:MAG TPA: hypothetical protein VN253_13995 [Kofleriaceae bacterium]|nr:hypothetical protein [Kofleriaceae bacterium]
MPAAAPSSPYSEPIAVPRPPRQPGLPPLVLLVVLVLVLAVGQCRLAHAPAVSPDRPLMRRGDERDLQKWIAARRVPVGGES